MSGRLEKRIAFVGAGQMAEALVAGLLAADVVDPVRLIVSDPSEARVALFMWRFGVRGVPSNRDAASEADIIVLAVKPHAVPAAGREMGPLDRKLVVSVAAGVTIRAVHEACTGAIRVARVMPNAAVVVREGMSAIAYDVSVNDEDRTQVAKMLESVGRIVVVEEHLLDAVTGVSGSGPAYVCLAMEALADGGVKMGLPRSIANRLAAQTLYGAARYVIESGQHPGQLKDQVASPGGTTIAGLHQLEAHAFRATVVRAVAAATRQAHEMGRSCSS